MTKTIVKWVNRCLGWILLGCVALAALCGYILHKKKGYGTIEVRVSWMGKAYPVDRRAANACELRVGGERWAWDPSRGVRLRPGPTLAELRVKDFRPCSAAVNVVKDVAAIAEFRLEAEPRTITIQNLKSNAVVNGEPCGVTWVLGNAEVGRRYAIAATAPGFHTNLLSLQIKNPGEDLITNLVWRPLAGFVSVKVTPVLPDTVAAVDGVPLGKDGGEPLGVGIHSLSVSNGDYYPRTLRVEVKNGCTSNYEIVLQPRPASLHVKVTPAAVPYQLHDGSGKLLALEGIVAKLPPGTNSVSITARGYILQHQDYVMAPNRSYSWTVQLRRQGEAVFAEWKRRFELLKLDGENGTRLGKHGGADWEKIRWFSFDSSDLVHGAEQYKEAYESLAELLKTMPERIRVQNNEVRSSNTIDYWIVMGEFTKASWKLEEYRKEFGVGSDFERWFGATAGKVKTWEDRVLHGQQFMPGKVPGGNKK